MMDRLVWKRRGSKMADDDQDQTDGSSNCNDAPDEIRDIGGAFVDAARNADVLGTVVDYGLEFFGGDTHPCLTG
jgi:hypothetical protein